VAGEVAVAEQPRHHTAVERLSMLSTRSAGGRGATGASTLDTLISEMMYIEEATLGNADMI
jgi:hypothetical protein